MIENEIFLYSDLVESTWKVYLILFVMTHDLLMYPMSSVTL